MAGAESKFVSLIRSVFLTTTSGTTEVKAMQKITPFLWYDGKAEEAANFYTSIFTA